MMLRMVGILLVAGFVSRPVLVLAQYASAPASSSSSSYASPSASYASAPVSSYATSAVQAQTYQYPSVNLPLLSIPVTLGNVTLNSAATSATGTAAATSTNYLASLPASALTDYAPYLYSYGATDRDQIRDAYYDHSNYYALNTYTSNLQGYGALNLSNPYAVAAAKYWGPYPYQMAAWSDGGTTAGTTAATTATTARTTAATAAPVVLNIANPSLYFAAYGGNTNGLGVAGLGLQVPGASPNALVSPSLNYAYNTGSSATAAPAAASPASSGSSSSYSNPAAGSSPSSPYYTG